MSKEKLKTHIRNEIDYTFENNFINGKPLGYFASKANLTISDDFGQLLLLNCTGITIKNQNITHTVFGMLIQNCSKIVVINNTINNSNAGIKPQWSSDILIINNSFSFNEIGILIDCTYNYWIHYNNFFDNSGYAIQAYNIGFIHHNNFFNNNPEGSSQAFCSTLVTEWYDSNTEEGNYWSDWSGEGFYDVLGSDSDDLYPLAEPIIECPSQFVLPWEQEQPTRTDFSLTLPVLFVLTLYTIVILNRNDRFGRRFKFRPHALREISEINVESE